MLYRSTTALVTLAVAFAVSGTAMADPYADEVISLQRENDPTQRYNTTGDTGLDPGTDALGAPDFVWGSSTAAASMTVLGYNPDFEAGGNIVLAFTNNVCVDGPGPDIRLYDANDDETAMVEVTTDGGATYTFVGEGFPGSYDIDLAGSGIASFNQFRVTALNSQTRLTQYAGIDLDAVECLNSADPAPGDPPPPPPSDNAALERCDLAAGSAGIDVKNVSLSSDGSNLVVKAQFCGPVEEKAYYKVYFDYTRDQGHHRRNYGSWYLRRYFKKYGGLNEPEIDPSAPDGPDTLDGNQLCKRTWDDRAAYKYGRTWGPGEFVISGDELTLTLDYGSLARGDGVAKGSKVLVWVRSWKHGFRDRAPNVETGDRCARPQFDHEVFEITLD